MSFAGMTFGFARPYWLLLVLPVGLYMVLALRGAVPALVFSRAPTLGRLARPLATRISRLPPLLRTAGILALIVALAGPRTGVSAVDVNTEGIAIVMALDISSSMLAEDFHPRNRISVAKQTMHDFITGRTQDRIGLVTFAGEALTQVPITVDYDVLYRALAAVDIGDLEDGTAIGTAIATAANRLRKVPGKSKVVILMTDGVNKRGEIDPLTAAKAAAAFGVKIYTIGIGTEGVAPIPVARGLFGYEYANLPVHIDEALLRQIARTTGGQYFRATTGEALREIYQQIDQLEKSPVTVHRYVDYTPWHLPFVLLAVGCMACEWALRASRWGRLP